MPLSIYIINILSLNKTTLMEKAQMRLHTSILLSKQITNMKRKTMMQNNQIVYIATVTSTSKEMHKVKVIQTSRKNFMKILTRIIQAS